LRTLLNDRHSPMCNRTSKIRHLAQAAIHTEPVIGPANGRTRWLTPRNDVQNFDEEETP
jgi:hypothetical protein